MEMGRACTIVVNKAAGTPTMTSVHSPPAHGVHWWNDLQPGRYLVRVRQGGTALDNDESWAKVTQAAAEPQATGLGESQVLLRVRGQRSFSADDRLHAYQSEPG